MASGVTVETYGQRIRRLRMMQGMTQNELAKLLSLPRSAMSMIEADKRRIQVDELLLIADILEVSPESLLGLGLDRYAEGFAEALRQASGAISDLQDVAERAERHS